MQNDMIYPLRIDRPTYDALLQLAANTDRSGAGFIRHLIRREAQQAGLIAPRPGEAQPERRGVVPA